MHYEFRVPDESTVAYLIEYSRLWKDEDCSHGMEENTAADIYEPLCVALDQGKIIGYIFGHFYVAENRTSQIEPGSRCFTVDELYVLPEYRGRGVGKALYRRMESKVKNDCSYITLTTSTKDYKRILGFYVDALDMDFHSAFLMKAMGE